MIKYTSAEIVFEEIPDEVTLAFNISNCQNHCEGCHSSFLRGNVGEELTNDVLDKTIKDKFGITCVCFMGEGNDSDAIKELIKHIKTTYLDLKIALYSGAETIDDEFYWDNLDYLKIGPYIAKYGPLNRETTNQRMYQHYPLTPTFFITTKSGDGENMRRGWKDITYLFWKR